jgi:hypothetical protein
MSIFGTMRPDTRGWVPDLTDGGKGEGVPQPKVSSVPLRAGLEGVIDSLLAAQHALEMFRRPLPNGSSRSCLDRLSNRLSKILIQVRKQYQYP